MQLQRVHCTFVLIFLKQPEGREANMWLLQGSVRLCCRHILNRRGIIPLFNCQIIANTSMSDMLQL